MILDEIVAQKKRELVEAKAEVPLDLLEQQIACRLPALDFQAAIGAGGVRLIAEIKKASPSKGVLRPDLDPGRLAGMYAGAGASAISVLTERSFFQGDLAFLEEARRGVESVLESGATPIPLLRKDFLFEPYQIYEARAKGSDAILLIVAILDDRQLRELLDLAHGLGMQCLVEVHDGGELERALESGARVIGINNRDLRTFKVDLDITRDLVGKIPADRLIVSESGIHSRDDVQRLAEWGVSAMLVGEALVTAGDLTAKIRELLS